MQERLSCPVRFEQKLPEQLARALDHAAQQHMTSRAGYVRAAILDRFKRGYALLLARPERTIVAILHSLPILYLLEAAAGKDPVARLGLLPYADPRKLDRAQVEDAIARLERWLGQPVWGQPAE